MSECSLEYAKSNLPFEEVNCIPVKHLSWSRLHEILNDFMALVTTREVNQGLLILKMIEISTICQQKINISAKISM